MTSLSELLHRPINLKPINLKPFLFFLLLILLLLNFSGFFDEKISSSRVPKDAVGIGGGFYKYEDGIWVETGSKGDFVFGGNYKAFKLNNVNLNTFVALGDTCPLYGKDKTHVFYESMIIENADVKSFSCLRNDEIVTAYSKDSSNVYYKGQTILNADPETFEELPRIESINPLKTIYAKDKSGIYFNGKEIDSAEYSTFTLLNTTRRKIPLSHDSRQPFYAKDKINVYANGNVLDFADPSSFQIIDDTYAKDENDVWEWNGWRDIRLENVDPEIFEIKETKN